MTDTLCPQLWNHYCVGVSGLVTPCCRSHLFPDQPRSDRWRNVDIEKGLLSKHHIEARQQMRNGERPPMCEACFRREDAGLPSDRQYMKSIYTVDYDIEPDNSNLDEIDIKFNRTCNLGCRMCDPITSSFLNKDLRSLKKEDRIANEPIEDGVDFDEDRKLKISKEFISKGCKTFKTTGGEPFLQKHFIELVDWCIENGYNKNLNMRITTNLILLNENLLNKLIKFKHVHINVSCDGVGEVYEYLRYPGKWDTFDKKWKLLINKDAPNLDVSVSAVLQIYNLFDVDNLYNYFVKQSYNKKLFGFTIDTEIHPAEETELCVDNLPNYILEQKIDCKHIGDYIKHAMTKTKNKKLISEFIRKTKIYDDHRNQSYTILDDRIVDFINRGNNYEPNQMD